MGPHKHIFAYTFLVIYAVTAGSGMLMLVGKIPVAASSVITGVFGFLIAQTATLLVAIIKAPNYFDDPKAVEKLKEEHAQMQKRQEALIAKLKTENSRLDSQIFKPGRALQQIAGPADQH